LALKEEKNADNKNTYEKKIEEEFVKESSKYKQLMALYERTAMQLEEERSIALKIS
jgi:hypothetical protein